MQNALTNFASVNKCLISAAKVINYLSYLSMQNSRVDKLKAMLEATPSDSFLRFALGLENIKAGQYTYALQYFQNIVSDDAEYTGVYYHLGKLYEQLGEPEKAIETYENGIKICRKKNDQHNLNELRGALDALM